MKCFIFKDKPEPWFGNNGDMAVTPDREYVWLKQNGLWGERIDLSIERTRMRHTALFEELEKTRRKDARIDWLILVAMGVGTALAMHVVAAFCRSYFGS